jgi:hypothetical protein
MFTYLISPCPEAYHRSDHPLRIVEYHGEKIIVTKPKNICLYNIIYSN